VWRSGVSAFSQHNVAMLWVSKRKQTVKQTRKSFATVIRRQCISSCREIGRRQQLSSSWQRHTAKTHLFHKTATVSCCR